MLHGYEVAARFGEAYAVPNGEHVDGTWGTIAATITACTLLNATPEQTIGAMNAARYQMSRSLFAPVKAGSQSLALFRISRNQGYGPRHCIDCRLSWT